MTNDQPSGGVSIGNITGGIHGSIIAGRDVGRATISAGGHPTLADKDPTLDELKQLLAEIQRELAEITAQQEALEAVSPAAPSTTHGAAQSVREVAEKLEPAMRTEAARSVYQRLTEATTLLSTILGGAKTVVEKAGELASTVKPLVEKLAPLVEKVGVAAYWVAKLWSLG